MNEMRRVLVIGSSGAGKSVFSRRLAAVLKLPLHHLDALYWKPGWVTTPREEWIRVQEDLVRGERWIIDGNYGSTVEIRLRAADTVILLDLPRAACLWGVLRRTFSPRPRPDMGPGCPQRLDKEFFEFLRWTWRFPIDELPAVLAKIEELGPGRRVVRLRSRAQVTKFLREVYSIRMTSGCGGPAKTSRSVEGPQA